MLLQAIKTTVPQTLSVDSLYVSTVPKSWPFGKNTYSKTLVCVLFVILLVVLVITLLLSVPFYAKNY